jgi:hypothetical protein
MIRTRDPSVRKPCALLHGHHAPPLVKYKVKVSLNFKTNRLHHYPSDTGEDQALYDSNANSTQLIGVFWLGWKGREGPHNVVWRPLVQVKLNCAVHAFNSLALSHHHQTKLSHSLPLISFPRDPVNLMHRQCRMKRSSRFIKL